MLSKSQYGFRENCSTQHPLIDIDNNSMENYTHAEYL